MERVEDGWRELKRVEGVDEGGGSGWGLSREWRKVGWSG